MKENEFTKASTFLARATLGADENLIKTVAGQGIENWLEEQLNNRPFEKNTYEAGTRSIWEAFRGKFIRAYGEDRINGDGNNPALPYKWYFRMAWWQHTLSHDDTEDLIRQRVAQALSELLVISDNSSLELDAPGLASFYDLLYNHAFGSYADLLFAVSMHPCMGVYLSHMNNRKADPSANIHPDENYARELMQLFTIGLVELNADGTRKKNSEGKDIPTYTNDDIKQLARVFTGLKAHSYRYEWRTGFWEPDYNGSGVGFDDGIDKTYKTVPFVTMTRPMIVDDAYHDNGPKSLLKGYIQLSGNQSGEDEIREVVNKLVGHPNTAPFMAKHLIRQMVTSNPSPEYVKAVADKFNEKGDLKAVVREVLTYPFHHRVRGNKDQSANHSQKLKSPFLRITQLLRAFRA
ncbi:MAG: DUF1800 domain-containing protein, partial [Desulfobacterales bacterium]|nr:DUF1800 domain-containing protein [Desulfobacterales bacterium]